MSSSMLMQEQHSDYLTILYEILSAVSWLQQTTAAGSQIVRQLDFTAGESCSGFAITTTEQRTMIAQMYATYV
jgi:hypothetical protein